MRCGYRPRHFVVAIIKDAERFQRVRIELDGQGRFSHGDVMAGDLSDVDIAVLGQGRGKQGDDTLEDGAARVSGKGCHGDFAPRGALAVIAALQEFVDIRDHAILEGEAMEHTQPIEPMAEGLRANFKLARAVTDQRAQEPRW